MSQPNYEFGLKCLFARREINARLNEFHIQVSRLVDFHSKGPYELSFKSFDVISWPGLKHVGKPALLLKESGHPAGKQLVRLLSKADECHYRLCQDFEDEVSFIKTFELFEKLWQADELKDLVEEILKNTEIIHSADYEALVELIANDSRMSIAKRQVEPFDQIRIQDTSREHPENENAADRFIRDNAPKLKQILKSILSDSPLTIAPRIDNTVKQPSTVPSAAFREIIKELAKKVPSHPFTLLVDGDRDKRIQANRKAAAEVGYSHRVRNDGYSLSKHSIRNYLEALRSLNALMETLKSQNDKIDIARPEDELLITARDVAEFIASKIGGVHNPDFHEDVEKILKTLQSNVKRGILSSLKIRGKVAPAKESREIQQRKQNGFYITDFLEILVLTKQIDDAECEQFLKEMNGRALDRFLKKNMY